MDNQATTNLNLIKENGQSLKSFKDSPKGREQRIRVAFMEESIERIEEMIEAEIKKSEDREERLILFGVFSKMCLLNKKPTQPSTKKYIISTLSHLKNCGEFYRSNKEQFSDEACQEYFEYQSFDVLINDFYRISVGSLLENEKTLMLCNLMMVLKLDNPKVLHHHTFSVAKHSHQVVNAMAKFYDFFNLLTLVMPIGEYGNYERMTIQWLGIRFIEEGFAHVLIDGKVFQPNYHKVDCRIILASYYLLRDNLFCNNLDLMESSRKIFRSYSTATSYLDQSLRLLHNLEVGENDDWEKRWDLAFIKKHFPKEKIVSVIQELQKLIIEEKLRGDHKYNFHSASQIIHSHFPNLSRKKRKR